MVITGVAEQVRNRIAAIVYLDAFMPENGQSLYEINHVSPPPGPAANPPPASYFHVNLKDEAWVNSKLTTHPIGCFTQELKVTGAYQSIPQKVYIRAPLFKIAAFDNALERCRTDRSWDTETVTCGHDVMIDQPEALTAIIERLV
jgi:hypothetical protein